MVNAIGLNVGKKRKGSEDDGMALKRVQKKKELLVETDGDVLSAKNDGKGGEENSNIGSLLQSIEKNIGAFDEGKSEERNGKGNLSRERKRSKYLSPPFTIPIRGQREVYIEPESLKVSRKAKVSQRSAGADGLSSLPMYKGSSNYQPQDDGETIIDPKKIQAPVKEVLSQVLDAATSPLIRREGTSLDQFVDFTYAFRSSLYSQGSLCELYKKNQPGRKRKMLESEEDGMLKELNLSTDEHLSSLKQNYGPKKRRKETASGKKGNEENAAGAVLFVSFWPGFSMPSRSDLVSVFSKFGALNEAETNMFRTNYTARVSFLRTSDAQKAYNHSQNNNPFGSPVDTLGPSVLFSTN
ncbi:Serine/threonine-protein kinase ATM [Glycine soja]